MTNPRTKKDIISDLESSYNIAAKNYKRECRKVRRYTALGVCAFLIQIGSIVFFAVWWKALLMILLMLVFQGFMISLSVISSKDIWEFYNTMGQIAAELGTANREQNQ